MRISRRQKIIYGLMLAILILLAPSVFSPEHSEGQIIYETRWDWGDAIPTEDGWQVMTDYGFIVEVTKGYVVSYSTQLNYCEHSHGMFDWLGNIFAVAVVQAGHDYGEDADPASVVVSMIESLDNPTVNTMGTVTVQEPSYCQGHYLMARGSSDSLNMPEDVDMYGLTLYIEGTYHTPDNLTPIAFTAQTNLANGKIRDLYTSDTLDTPIHVGISETPVRVAIVRSLDSMFDGIEFDSMTGEDIGKAVLWTLLEELRFVILDGEIHQ